MKHKLTHNLVSQSVSQSADYKIADSLLSRMAVEL